MNSRAIVVRPFHRRNLRAAVRVLPWLIGTLSATPAPPALTEAPLTARSTPAGSTMFTVMPPEQTGIVTENNYADPRPNSNGYKDPRQWADRYHEFQVGAVGTGVAIGDYDGDGRPDIFVVSKTESCRLFRNLGGWKFEDVTDKAGVGDKGDAAAIWKQGATFVDVNNDGRLDIYVCRFAAPNLLYINQGDGTFREEAAARGLAVNDSSVMAAFCDYDRDGWLDVFIQTNLLDGNQHPDGQKNYLFHNNRDGTFTDVTGRAGIRGEAQGHSADWWDFDGDGWPDLYVANDFAAPDKLYHNNRDGTFTNVISAVVPHMPYSSMGSDFGDVNNDGLIDLFVADMAATTHQKDQRGMASLRAQVQQAYDESAGPPQDARNVLYVSTGTGRMLEAAYLAGVAATDWTWAPRLEDLDNDGRLDLFVTNGMHREVHNVDLLRRLLTAQTQLERIRIEKASPVLNERNLAFRNRGDLRFENVGAAWGLDAMGVSFGAAFGDLDGDGDLDLVYANYRKGVTVLRNDSSAGHRVMFALRGTRSNRFGVGTIVRIETSAGPQVRQLMLARGVLSSSDPVLHFGLGDVTRIQRVTVTWPSGAVQVFKNLDVDRRYTITEPSEGTAVPASTPEPPSQFEIISAPALSLTVREPKVDEFAEQPLLPVRQNRGGPAIAAGDLDGDGRDDVAIGGSTLDPARVVIDGHVSLVPQAAAAVNDGPILLFDANGDGANDLLITRGGVGLVAGSPDYSPRLWLNDGHGTLRPAPTDALPPLPISAGAAAAADFDHDGRLDLFLGGRVLPGMYPFAPKSALLANRGGRFEDITDAVAPALREIGMVTAALWSDVDQDGWPDLLVATEWGTVHCFHNRGGQRLEDWTERLGFAGAGTGWWNSIAAADFNGDGRMDYVVGNVGLNTPYHADAAHPAVLYVGDFNGDGGVQLLEGDYEGDRLFPRRTRKVLGESIPSLLRRYPKNDLYAEATLEQIVGADKLAAATRYAATELRSGVFLSQSDGTYRFAPLPRLAQIAPIEGVVAGDFDGDGHADIVVVQNSYAPAPYLGRFDGGLGLFLRGDGQGHFAAVPPRASGLVVPGDAKGLIALDLDGDGWPDLVATRNNDSTLVFRNRAIAGRNSVLIRLVGPRGNPSAVGARVSLELRDGAVQCAEISAGGGYRSQSTAAAFFGFRADNPPRALRVRWPNGGKATYPAPTHSGVYTFEAAP